MKAKRALGILAWLGGSLCACSSDGGGASTNGPDGGAAAANDGSASTGGDDGGVTPGDDDATTGTVDATDGNPRATTCTAPPFFVFKADLTELRQDNTQPALAGATVAFSTCVGFELTTDPAGGAETQVTQNITFTPIYTAPGHISALGAESPAFGDTEVAIELPQDGASSAIPGYSGAVPTLEVVLSAEGTSPCNKVDGVTLAVTSHPEATFSYMKATWPVDRNVGSTTVSLGPRVFVGGLADGDTVQVTGTKSGCQVKTVTSSQTGNASLLLGSLTIMKATVTN